MSEIIRATITRAGVNLPVASNIVIQLDKMQSVEAASYAGADPHFTYTAITTLIPINNPQAVLFRDHMVDQVVIDPVTKTNRTYLIVSDPEPNILTGSWRWVCTRMRGT